MVNIILTILVFVCGIFMGLSCGIHLITEHMMQYNRLTKSEAAYYYSLRNLWHIFRNE